MIKDSIILKDGVIYYGKLVYNERLLDSAYNLNTLNKIKGASIKSMRLDSRKRSITIAYNKNDEETIQLDQSFDMQSFINEILTSFQHARILNDNKTLIHLIRKPLIAILVILFLILIISLNNPYSNLNAHSSKFSSQAIFDLLNGFALLGMPTVILIFGTLMLIPILNIILKMRKREENTVIKF